MKLPSIKLVKPKYQVSKYKGLTEQQIVKYHQAKMEKQIKFFEDVTPYFTIFTGVCFAIGMVVHLLRKKNYENGLWDKIYYHMLDLEVKKHENNNISKLT